MKNDETIESYADRLPLSVIDEIKENTSGSLSKEKIKLILDETVKAYDLAKVNAGECVGLISAESIGEPGTQMSLDFAEKVIVKSGNKIKTIEIGKFIDKVMEAKLNYVEHYVKQNDTEVCEVSDAEIFVPAISQNEKLEWKKVTALSRHQSPTKLLKLTTRSGRKITATPYHSFVIRKDNKVLPVAGSSLKLGDRIPTAKKITNMINNRFLNLKEYLPPTKYIYESELQKATQNATRKRKDNDFGNCNNYDNYTLPIKSYEQINNYVQGNNTFQLQQNCVYMYQNHSTAQIPEVLELDALFGFFVGAYLAEGTHTPHYVAITNSSPEYLQKVTEFAEKYNINYKIKYEMGEYGESVSFLLYSTLIADFLVKTCGKGAFNKYVPDFAYSANRDFAGALLQAYFDGDGNINVPRRVIRASSSSKELRDGISLLLSQEGIFTTKSTTNKGQYTLAISYRYAPLFEKRVGLTIPRKSSELKKLAEIHSSETSKTSYDIVDMIPGCGSILSTLGKKLGLASRYTNKFTRKQKIGRQALLKYVNLFERKAEEKQISIEKVLKILKNAINSDVVWDEIVKTEYVQPTNKYVYDFSVEELETFTTFDGVVTHNTLNTFHFAGVAEMNVTTGLPRIIEIFDARKEIKTPMMEIFLNSPHNTLEKVKDFATKIRETMFGELVEEYSLNIFEQTLKIKLNRPLLDHFSLTSKDLIKLIKTKAKGFTTEHSEDEICFTHKGKPEEIKELYNLKEKIRAVKVRGVKKIKQVLPVKRGEEYIILTSGTNLKDILGLPEVDPTRTFSNDIHEVCEILGVEAARQAIINEVYRVIESQGLNINIRHIMLVADIMCAGGNVKGITRYGVVSEKASVLARASFETPIKHLINAALEGETDNLTSVVENVMINQPVPLGTGLPSLVTKMK